MKNRLLKIASATLLVAMAFTAMPALSSPASAAVTNWHKSVSIGSRWNTDFESDSFKQSVRNAQAMGATHVSLIIPYMQDNYQTSHIYKTSNTPSDETLGKAIDFIHSLGMKVALKPHLETSHSGWRALIEAQDRNTWYTNYGAILNNLANVGQKHGADMIVLGTELIGMASPYVNPDNTQRWKTLISQVRERYSGAITYSANWGRGMTHTNEFEQIGFWPELDYIGISAYFDLGQDWGNYSVETLKSAWKTIDERQVAPLAAKYGKPVLFTEVGYKPVDGAHTRPWDYNLGGNYNPQMQVNLFQALFEYWNTRSYVTGISIWEWSSDPNYGGDWNLDYTPYGKPAAQTIKGWFGSNQNPNPDPDPNPNPNPDPGPGTPPTGDWNSSASLSGAAVVGSEASFSVSVTNTGEAKNFISDIEIYDSSNSKIFQKFFEGQNVTSSSPGNYTVAWTPQSTGDYKLKVGTFSSGWTTNYYWNDNALSFTAVNPGQNPPGGGTSTPSTYYTDIWWPGEGAVVGGTQPWKAMLEGKHVSEYQMYWQVDGRDLVEMYNSDVDYPHKEFMVDLQGWNWNSDNRYNVNFVSKDPSGSVISERSVNIVVPR